MTADYRWIDDPAALDELLDELTDEPRYAIDTEFHRERTYWPRLALLQIAWTGGIALVDPLAVDVAPFARILAGPGLAVLHAAQQDLEVLQRACGTVPARLFDTQLAAGFAGYSTPSLASLLAGELKIHLPKGDRLTDWLRRPLTDEQKAYAASDVAHLFDLHDRLVADLTGSGRLAWAEAECEALRVRPTGPGDPDQAWLKLKDARSLKPKGRVVARAVAGWRERRAASTDTPVRSVVPDLAILGLAQRPPRTPEELRATRGLDDRHSRGAISKEILAAVQDGLATPLEVVELPDVDDVDRTLRPAVTLVSAWVSQLARDKRLDTALLATRSDLVDLLLGRPDAALSTGWRAAAVGDDIRRLVQGEAALAFDGKGNLRLVDLPENELTTPELTTPELTSPE